MNDKKYYLTVNKETVEVSFEVYKLYHKYQRKELYFFKELKEDRKRINPISNEVEYLPSLEDSYDRIVEVYGDIFAGEMQKPEEIILQKEIMGELSKAIDSLKDHEKELIRNLFFLNKTEKEIARELNLSVKTINYHKHKILAKLKRCMPD